MIAPRYAFAPLACLAACTPQSESTGERLQFDALTVAPGGEDDPWAKAWADVDGDGRLDVIVGGRASREIVAYLAPDWRRRVLQQDLQPSTGLAAADVDGDGRVDLVLATDRQLILLQHADGPRSVVGDGDFHDVVLADVDGDGKRDAIARGQSAFRGDQPDIHIFLNRAGRWRRSIVAAPPGEGLAVADIDADGRADLVINGTWFRNGGNDADGAPSFSALAFGPQWQWPHVKAAAGDIDGDGRLDVVLVPSEAEGSHYRAAWFRHPTDPAGSWTEHTIAARIEAVQHSLQLADFDGDGRLDVFLAAMHQGRDPDEVAVYLNERGGASWVKTVLGKGGSHNAVAADFDGDGDVDIFGAGWSGPDQSVRLWRNRACDASPAGAVVRRAVTSGTRNYVLFIRAADLDGDGRVDLVAGPNWYRNPQKLDLPWELRPLGGAAQNALLTDDFDADGRPDVFYTTWTGERADSRVGVAWNAGQGAFRIAPPVAVGAGDFPQGVTVLDRGGDATRIALSWHGAGTGLDAVRVPRRPEAALAWSPLSEISQNEALSAGDIDGDGEPDLLLGTWWLAQEGGRWVPHRLSGRPEPPDRSLLADMNGDGRLDAVVGYEAISKPGRVAWYEQPENSRDAWIEHEIGTVVGPMSLGVADGDGDGDLDVYVGEHNLEAPETAALWFMENRGGDAWRPHRLATGDEHHDGLIATDLDGDGDIDVASIGWSHDLLLIYESLGAGCMAARVNQARAKGGRT